MPKKEHCQRCEILCENLVPKLLVDKVYFVCEDCYRELVFVFNEKDLTWGEKTRGKEKGWYVNSGIALSTVYQPSLF